MRSTTMSPRPTRTLRYLTRSLRCAAAALSFVLLLSSGAGAAETLLLTATPDDRSVQLAWTPVSGATRYEIRRDGTPVGTVAATTTTWTDTALQNGTTHAYRVAAVRPDGTTAATGLLNGTPVDLRAPTVVTAPRPSIRILDGGFGIAFSIPPEAAADAAAYHLYVDGHLADVAPGGELYVHFFVGGLLNQATELVLGLVDKVGNLVTLPAWRESPFDLEPPPIPLDLRLLSCVGDAATLAWDTLEGGSERDQAVGFRIYRDGKHVADTTQRTHRATGLAAGVPTRFTVAGVDAYGRESPKSYELTVAATGMLSASTRAGVVNCLVTAPERPELPPAPAVHLEATSAAGLTNPHGAVVYLKPRDQRSYAGYRLYVGDTVARTGSVQAAAPYVSVELPPTHQGTISVELFDLHGQASPRTTIGVRTLAQLAPAIVSGLSADGATVSWNPADGATAYDIEIDGRTVTTTSATATTLLATSAPTVRTVRIIAVDAHGQRSTPSDPLFVTS